MISQAKIIYLEVDIGMTGAPADWRLDNSWKEGGRVDAGADAASANAFNQPPPGYPQYQLLALAVEKDKMTKMYPTTVSVVRQ